MKKPAYYLAVFGRPEPPDKDTVDSGRFHLGLRGADTPGERGDVLLLYSAVGGADQAPGVTGAGVVLTKTKDSIFYRYLPFASPVPRDRVEQALAAEDRAKLATVKSNTFWLFEISHASFANATKGVPIRWP